jgi:large subunit ribosomal protein L20
MPRTKSSVASRKRRKKILKQAKGFRGGRSKLYRTAKDSVRRALQHSYEHRKLKKRTIRKLWITRLNAAVREHDLTYSKFIHGLKLADIKLNRKTLSNMAIEDPESFKNIVDLAKKNLNNK